MTGWSKTTTYLSIALVGGGFVLIVLGWNGAANLDRLTGQIPFVLSGGIAGVGLVLAGVVLALVQESRRVTADLTRKFDELIEVTSARTAAGTPTASPTQTAELNERQRRALERAGLN